MFSGLRLSVHMDQVLLITTNICVHAYVCLSTAAMHVSSSFLRRFGCFSFPLLSALLTSVFPLSPSFATPSLSLCFL